MKLKRDVVRKLLKDGRDQTRHNSTIKTSYKKVDYKKAEAAHTEFRRKLKRLKEDA